jgi:hypothetical protein
MSIPLVTLTAFSNLAGAALGGDIRHLLASPVYTHLVLFSDVAGEQLAILPVGPGQPYKLPEELHGKEIEGLRPLCALRTEVDVIASADIGEKSARPAEDEARLVAREKELARKEESLRTREQYVAECEHRMAQVGQNLAEREALVDHREAMVMEKEREFFRRGGEATRRSGGLGVEVHSLEA